MGYDDERSVVVVTSRDPVVLVVEDDPRTAELYARWLRERWTTRVAHDEAEALASLDGSVSVALIDRDLAGGSGDAVLSVIRERDVGCRVAMVTGVVPDADVVDMGFDEYLTKPVGPEHLRATVSELLLRSTYDERVREYYALARKRALLEAEHDPAELADSEEYTELCRRLADTSEAADEVVDELAERDAYEGLCREVAGPSASV